MAALAGAADARAATFEVENLAESGPGSLRQALDDANATPGTDTITFADGLSGTIPVRDVALEIREPVRLQGPGADRITLDGAAPTSCSRSRPPAPPWRPRRSAG